MDKLIDIQLEIFSKTSSMLNNVKEKMKRKIAETDLSETIKYELYTRLSSMPDHNKICHGDQLDFGTKEHSLKAVLVIDMLIQLAYEIARIITIKNENKIGDL